jgi:23S rRNA (cytidine2498-2'-O)-methyltransferase
MLTAYLAPLDLEEALGSELKNIVSRHGRLFLTEGPCQKTYWAQNIWIDAKILPFTSISHAAKQLRGLHGLWAYYPHSHIRRAALISAQLPYFSPKPLTFPCKLPLTAPGSWTLLDESTLLASAQCTSFFANGEVHFQETKEPPSRAYLKLWEIFTKIGQMPLKGQKCLEAGASPGSWTWVLQKLGAEVIAVDRAELDPKILKLPSVQYWKKDAFSLSSQTVPDIEWVFSDMICYPAKLLQWISQWNEVNLVCTIKFQGKEDYKIIPEFEKIEKSRIFHLYHNKHELTWVKLHSWNAVPNPAKGLASF